ncbi:MAG: WYL domain-containing protein [Microbacteriaceae bacterium]|nr:WYL domain-containing protein [Microbacteriaceae bacterium]
MAKRGAIHPANERLLFLLALVPWLADHDGVTVSQAAQHFAVTAEAVREAVRLIAVSGIPGETSQYQHGDLFDIAWDRFEDDDEIQFTNLVAIDNSPRFSAREAAAIIAGLQYLSGLPEAADRNAVDSLMVKLARGASGRPSQVAVETTDAGDTLHIIRAAVANDQQIEFDYVTAKGEREHRQVDPLRVESMDSDWYLRGWCHSRQAVRTFRIDRITDPELGTLPRSVHPEEVTLPETLFEGSPGDVVVSVDVAPQAMSLIADYLASPPSAIPIAQNTAEIVVPHFHAVKRLIAGLSGLVTIIDPPEARKVTADWAARGLEQYGKL